MKNKTVKMIVIIVAIIIRVDQASKLLVSNLLTETIGNDFFKLEIANNTGMAFGFNDGNIKNIFTHSAHC